MLGTAIEAADDVGVRSYCVEGERCRAGFGTASGRSNLTYSVCVDHFDGTALFTVGPHRPLAIQTSSAGHAELRNLRAVLSM